MARYSGMPFVTWMPIKGSTYYLGKAAGKFVFRDTNGKPITLENAVRFPTFTEAQGAVLRADRCYRDDFPRIEQVTE